jgi:HAMP domain-containing protein
MSLVATIRRDFIAVIVIFGLLISGIAYYVLRYILQERFEQQGSFMAINLADASASRIVSRDVLQLHTLVTKYSYLDGVAYVIVQDRDGKMLASSLDTSPSEIQEHPAYGQGQALSRGSVSLQGKSVYEFRGPILEGQLGTAHIGIWADRIEREINRGFVILMGPIALLLVATATISVLLAGRLIRSLRRLMEIAGRMSAGDLDTPVRSESQDEFGELTHSLERMRASLKAAMMRLDQNYTRGSL